MGGGRGGHRTQHTNPSHPEFYFISNLEVSMRKDTLMNSEVSHLCLPQLGESNVESSASHIDSFVAPFDDVRY